MSIEKTEGNNQNEIQVNGNTNHVEEETSTEDFIPKGLEFITLNILLPHDPHKIQVTSSLSDTTLELRQSISENPFSYYFSCFYMEHDGIRLGDYQDLSTIKGLKEKPEIVLKPNEYTEREARLHIIRLNELLACYQKPRAKLGYDENSTAFNSIAPSSSSKKKSKKKESKEPKVVAELNNHAFENYDFNAPYIGLSSLLPNTILPPAPKCLKSIDFSGWSPVPPIRKAFGDLLYLTVTTLENKTFEITSNRKGFYVNNSTSEKFDPSIKTPAHSHEAHSLVTLLQKISPLFRSGFSKLQQTLLTADVLSTVPANTHNVIYPWLASPSPSTYEPSRNTESFLYKGTELADNVRDWNEEIQSIYELPQKNLHDKVLRDRALYKTYSDFHEQAIQVVTQIADGNLLAINITDPVETHMWALNNIFVTRTYDSNGQFEGFGDEADAAYVATSKDINGVKILNSLDLQDLRTFASVVIDYRGERYIAQAVIPGLFRMHGLIKYGSTGNDNTILSDSEFHELVAQISDKLNLAPHTMVSGNGEHVELNLSADTKGIFATEGRRYLVDLHRLFPVDINFIDKECIDGDNIKSYPHKMTLLRHELLARFWEHKYSIFKEEKLATMDKEKEEKKAEDGTEESKSPEETLTEKLKIENALRKEFSLKFNPDVFTNLPLARDGEYAAKVAEDEAIVRAASEYIVDVAIPSLVSDLGVNLVLSDSSTLTKNLHNRGINMRYLGIVSKALENSASRVCKSASRVFIAEMFIRSIKRLFRQYIRELPVTLINDAIAHLFNCLFSLSPSVPSTEKDINGKPYKYQKVSSESLMQDILDTVALRFRYPATIEHFKSLNKVSLLREICLVTGIQLLARDYNLTPQSTNKNLTNGTDHKPTSSFNSLDIIAIVPKLKDTLHIPTYPDEILEDGRNAFTNGLRPIGLDHMVESIQFFEQVFGNVHPLTAHCYSTIASVYSLNDDMAKAEDFQKKALVTYERSMGIDHPETLQTYIQYGFYLTSLGRIEEGLKYLRFALDRWYSLYDCPNLNMAFIDFNLGTVFQKYNTDLSMLFFKRAMDVIKDLNGEDDIQYARCQHSLASLYCSIGDYKTAIALEKEAQIVFNRDLGSDKPLTIRSNQVLQDYTYMAVKAARNEILSKTPEYKELQNKAKKLLKKEEERLLREKEKSIPNKGHLPLDDLVKYIDGKPLDRGTKKKNKTKTSNSKQKPSQQ